MSGVFTYYAYDLMTMTLLAELPFRDASFGRILNEAGDFHGDILLSAPECDGINVIGGSIPSRTLLAIALDQSLVWTGIIWTREFDFQTKVLHCTGKEIWSYFERRQQVDYDRPPGLAGTYWNNNPAEATDVALQVIWDKLFDSGSGVGAPIMVGARAAGGFMYSGTNYTMLDLKDTYLVACPVPNFLPSGSVLYLVCNNGTIQTLTTTADANQGDTTISVASFTPTTTIVGGHVWETFASTTPSVSAKLIPAQGWPPQMTLQSSIDTAHIAQSQIICKFPKQQRQSVEMLVRQLAVGGIGTGFDFSIEPAWLFGPGGPITFTLTVYFPVKGATQYALDFGVNGLMVDLDAAQNFIWHEDGFKQATKVYAVGQSTVYLEQEATSTHALAAGYPLLEELFPFIMQNTNSQLSSAARGELSLDAFPVLAPKVVMPCFGFEPELGNFSLGDTMRLFQSDDTNIYFATGLDSEMRCVDWQVTVPPEGVPTMELTFNIPPVDDPARPTHFGL